MKHICITLLLLSGFSLMSCEQLLHEVIDEALYGHQKAKCEVVYQSPVNKITEGKALMEIKVKNKGQLDACNLTVFAALIKGDEVIEEQSVYLDYLSSKSSKTITVTFYKIIYGSEYDSVDIQLWYDEVEREDYDYDDDW
jgi:uncharacterized protein (TIGR02588 family)